MKLLIGSNLKTGFTHYENIHMQITMEIVCVSHQDFMREQVSSCIITKYPPLSHVRRSGSVEQRGEAPEANGAARSEEGARTQLVSCRQRSTSRLLIFLTHRNQF